MVNRTTAAHLAGVVERWGPKHEWTLVAGLRRAVREDGDRPFVAFGDGPFETFAECLASSEDVGARIRALGVAPGERVCLMADNSLDHVHLWFGINLAGAVELALNTGYRGHSLTHAVNLSGAAVLITERQYLDRLADVEDELEHVRVVATIDSASENPFRSLPVVDFWAVEAPDGSSPTGDVRPQDPASVLLTSGTTGPSKGVLMSHGQIFALAQYPIDHLELTPDDVIFSCHTLYHSTKFVAVLGAVLAGCRLVLDPKFVPEVWTHRVASTGATFTIAHGPMLDLVCARPPHDDDGRNKLRTVLSSGTSPDLRGRFRDRFGVETTEAFGITELGMITSNARGAGGTDGSMGYPLDELLEVRVADPDTDEPVGEMEVGELQIRPRHSWLMMLGYLGMPDKTAEAWRNLWFHTGDLVRQRADGRMFFVERASERIRRRAENVSAYEIELAASAYPRVIECAAVGVPSDLEGSFDDDVKLAVVLDDPEEPFDPADLLTHLVRTLPHYMVPRYVEVLPALPRTSAAKVQKALIRGSGTAGSWDRTAAGVSVRALSEAIAAGSAGTSPG